MAEGNFKTPDLLDGVAMSILYETFEVPSPEEIAKIKTGDNIKVGAKQNIDENSPNVERFWCKVIGKQGDSFLATVNNDLVLTHLHGLKFNDLIKIESYQIIGII